MRIRFLAFFLIGYHIAFAQTGINSPWTWINGDSTTNALSVFGAQGVSSNLNKPGARVYSFQWTDGMGDLWLFGGSRTFPGGNLNDLWKYNSASNEWVWMKGGALINEFGIYGTKGISNPANTPGARSGGVAWMDTNGNLWLFGGAGYAQSGSLGDLNDLWKYDPLSNEWTWMKGENVITSLPVYGTQGISSPSNTPGSRDGSTGWRDTNGNFWLFGGEGRTTPVLGGYLNELWKFNPASNEWTWVNGANTADQNGVYGVQGVSNSSNKPGSRSVCGSWVDNSGNFWIIGGYGYSSNSTSNEELNDLWRYNATLNEWTWMKGDILGNQPGLYGTQGLAGISNVPPARDGVATWKDANGDFWMFGGYGVSGYYNDLWRYDLNSNNWTWMKGDNIINQHGVYGSMGTVLTTNKPGVRHSPLCWTDNLYNFWLFGGRGYAQTGGTGTLNDLWKINSNMLIPLTLLDFSGSARESDNLLQWQTSNELNSERFIIERNLDGRSFTTIGTIDAVGNSSVTKDYVFYDKYPCSGTSFYRLKILDKDGRFNFSKTIAVKRANDFDMLLFPNPAKNILFVQLKGEKGIAILKLIDITGKTVKENSVNVNSNSFFSINIEEIPKGIYQFSIKTKNTIFQRRVVIY